MDIKQLYYFTAVAQAGSYSKAAESLAVSQPTLSVTVKKLEEELGVQLFYAFNREQHLTDEGLRLWTKAKQILDLYQETLDDMKTTNKNSSGKFTLGLSPLFGACFFGDLIPNFSMEYPNIEIKMIEDGAYRIDQRINSKLEQVASLRALATKATSTLSDTPPSGSRNVQSMENVIVKIIDLENEINEDIDTLVDLKREIVGVIKRIDNPEYQTLLELRYLCFYSWEKVAVEMEYDLRYLHKLHRKALEQCSAFVPAGK